MTDKKTDEKTDEKKHATYDDFARVFGVTMTVKRTDRNPFMGDDMDHWRVTLHRGGETMSIVYSQGRGFDGQRPTLARVLRTLADDAALAANTRSFAEYCRELGYEDNSHERARYEHLLKQVADTKHFFLDVYDEFLYSVSGD
jgi:hypothetical protein